VPNAHRSFSIKQDAVLLYIGTGHHMTRVDHNPTYTLYMTTHLVISLPKLPYNIYIYGLANSTYGA